MSGLPFTGFLVPSGGAGGGSGDVVGPASSTDNAITRYDGTTGKLLQNSGVTISDANVVSGATQLNVDNLRLDGNTLSTTDTNGNLVLNPDGTGDISLFGETATDLRVRLATSPSPSTGPAFRIITGNAGSGADLLASSIFSPNETSPTVGISNGIVTLASGSSLGWYSSSGDFSGSRDTGLGRSAAGVVKVTDGSTGIRGLLGGGAAVASAAAMPLPTGRVFHVTGTTNITSITSTNFQSGAVVTLIFDDVLTFTDGNNLVLAGNFVTTANDTITLAYDGTNWYETGRSVN